MVQHNCKWHFTLQWIATLVGQQLQCTMCCTSISHREHKQRQQNISERTHVPGRAVTLFLLMWKFSNRHGFMDTDKRWGKTLPSLANQCVCHEWGFAWSKRATMFYSCSSVKREARAGNVFSIDWLLFSICSPLLPPLLRIGKPLTSETLVAEHLEILPISSNVFYQFK